MASNLPSAWTAEGYPRLTLRARQLAGQVASCPNLACLKDLFSDQLLRHRSLGQLARLLRSLWEENGEVVWLEPLHAIAENVGLVSLLTTRGRRLRLSLSLDLQREGKVAEFSCHGDRLHSHFESLLEAFEKLPGQAGLCCWQLTPEGPREVLSYQPDQALSVASLYKIYVLGALVHSQRWEETVVLQDGARSFPSGILHQWPAAFSVSARMLAALMISLSDNTAAQHLLQHLGRAAVESAVVRLGHSQPGRMTPFLSSLDHFRLKSRPEEGHCQKFLQLTDPQARADYLQELAAQPKEQLGIPLAPLHLEAGWWASPADICRALSCLAESPDALEILSINPGLPANRNLWPLMAFKGGSEPGAVAGGWLLESADKRRYALAAAWNNNDPMPDQNGFFALLESLIEILPEGRIGPNRYSLYPILSPCPPWWRRLLNLTWRRIPT